MTIEIVRECCWELFWMIGDGEICSSSCFIPIHDLISMFIIWLNVERISLFHEWLQEFLKDWLIKSDYAPEANSDMFLVVLIRTIQGHSMVSIRGGLNNCTILDLYCLSIIDTYLQTSVFSPKGFLDSQCETLTTLKFIEGSQQFIKRIIYEIKKDGVDLSLLRSNYPYFFLIHYRILSTPFIPPEEIDTGDIHHEEHSFTINDHQSMVTSYYKPSYQRQMERWKSFLMAIDELYSLIPMTHHGIYIGTRNVLAGMSTPFRFSELIGVV